MKKGGEIPLARHHKNVSPTHLRETSWVHEGRPSGVGEKRRRCVTNEVKKYVRQQREQQKQQKQGTNSKW